MQFNAEQGENMIQRWFLEMHRIHFTGLIFHRPESAGIVFLKEAFKKWLVLLKQPTKSRLLIVYRYLEIKLIIF